MNKTKGYVKNVQGSWLHKLDIWSYDEVVRQFKSEGYSWIKSQEKADVIFGIAIDPDLKKIWRSV